MTVFSVDIPTIETDRLILREARESDLDDGACGFIFREGWDEPELGWNVHDGYEGQSIAFEAASADAILVYTLGERFKHTQAVGKLKAEHELPASDPTREATQIARLEDLANRADLDPEFAKKFLNFIIEEVIHHHKQHQT